MSYKSKRRHLFKAHNLQGLKYMRLPLQERSGGGQLEEGRRRRPAGGEGEGTGTEALQCTGPQINSLLFASGSEALFLVPELLLYKAILTLSWIKVIWAKLHHNFIAHGVQVRVPEVSIPLIEHFRFTKGKGVKPKQDAKLAWHVT